MSPMLEDMQDMLFSATRRKRLLVESKSILLLTARDAGEVGQRHPRVSHHGLPEQTQELAQGELEGHQELCLVQQGEGLFTDVTFNNYLKPETVNHAGY